MNKKEVIATTALAIAMYGLGYWIGTNTTKKEYDTLPALQAQIKKIYAENGVNVVSIVVCAEEPEETPAGPFKIKSQELKTPLTNEIFRASHTR